MMRILWLGGDTDCCGVGGIVVWFRLVMWFGGLWGCASGGIWVCWVWVCGWFICN